MKVSRSIADLIIQRRDPDGRIVEFAPNQVGIGGLLVEQTQDFWGKQKGGRMTKRNKLKPDPVSLSELMRSTEAKCV